MNKTAETQKSNRAATAAAQLEVMSLLIQQLEIVAAGIGVAADVKLEAARLHSRFSSKRQKMLLALGR
jgi:hypothetical protein